MTFNPLRNHAALILASALAIAIVASLSGFAGVLDRALDPLRFQLLSHPASGRIAVVEMDAASIAAIDRWPWSRDNHARLVDRLRQAGAASVVFDVDFSSPSDAAGDRAFAAALQRSPGLVALATLSQEAQMGAARQIDSLPIPILRDHATLQSVSIAPDSDGTIRAAPFGTITDATPRPSLSAYVAGRSGAADDDFTIDYSIDAATIPRLSFVAVRDGRFDRTAVAGRDVIVGATAVEMGDRYATPRWGVIPGVIIQALAAETLIAGVPRPGGETIPILAALVLAIAILRARTVIHIAVTSLVATLVLIGAALAAQRGASTIFPIAAGLLLLLATLAGRYAQHVLGRFRHQQLIDEETGLGNRKAMVLALAARPALRLAVAHIADLESLVAVLGHSGERDLVLRVTDRLRLASRDGAIFRLTDRLLAFELGDRDTVDDAMAGLRTVMLQPVEVAGRRVDVALTIGVADGQGDAADACLTSAALAAENAAQGGVFWRQTVADMAVLERRLSLMGELDDALANGQIEVHYQPKLALAQDRIASVEALVRWRHPERGFIGPDHFIPLAEQTGRVAPLTLFVLARVIEDLAHWRSIGLDLTAAVNISAKLVTATRFNADVRGLLAQDHVPIDRLIFEVTESATLADPQAAVAALVALRDLGIGISMDDYGTGQSTLTYLRTLPLSELKIDRSFVQHAHVNHKDGVMVRSTIDLAHDLGLKVVAEGIEDADCLAFLRAAGCDMAQGYHISRPIPAAALVELLRGDQALAA
ncbi:putative bifunctional diguanylate cyclase/phosphodiesterase [Sphingomonas sp. Tas61C01]|uniref:putative bifunctional diguanylate cyclase/phosphodiesterase n=1 Tax=Sphingomonas sp. Tas61C01 TaxID=3458297 RepID=UPI00403EB441